MTSVDSVDYVRGLKGKDSVLIKPDDLPHPNTGSGINVGDIYRGKWYRIAIRTDGSFPFVSPSSGIFNVVNNYNNTPSKSVLFYAFVEGYDNGSSFSDKNDNRFNILFLFSFCKFKIK